MRICRLLAITAAAGLTALGMAHAAASESYYRTHELQSLDYRVAETLAWEICNDQLSDSDTACKIEAAEHKLVVLGPDQVHAEIVRMLADRDPATRAAQRFEVILLRTVEAPGSSPSEFPPHVRAALDGVRELMPATGFKILATGWVLTSGQGATRLVDGDGNRYIIQLHYRGRRIGLERTMLSLDVKATADNNNPNLRYLMETSISIDLGETVVVGSSVGYDEDDPILFLLLTAQD